MIRLGILGCGDVASRHALAAMSMPNRVEMAAFCDRDPARASAFASKFSPGTSRTYPDHETMFTEAKLDAVIICLPPFAHTDEVRIAANHGVHILIEKPIALTSREAWAMVAAAEKAGIKTQVGFMMRFGEAVERFREMQRQGSTGPVGLMSARYFCNSLHAPWWRSKEKSGGQILEQIIHMFDLCRVFAGEPVSVFCRRANLFHTAVPGYTIEDVSATILAFSNGGMASIYATNNAIPGRWINDFRVVTQHATAEFRGPNHATFSFTGSAPVATAEIASDRDFRAAQLSDLLDAIEGGGETRTPIREGAKSVDLVLAACRSADEGREVRL